MKITTRDFAAAVHADAGQLMPAPRTIHLRRGDDVACGAAARPGAINGLCLTLVIADVTCGRCRSTYAGRSAAAGAKA